MKKIPIETAKAPAPIGPYSQAILVNNTLYVSGQIAINVSTGQLVTENIIEETHQVMKNLEAILAAADMNFQNVVKCSIFIKNMDDFATINEVYGQFFSEMPPARETVEVARLPKNVNVEISCIAVV
jgi:2-iminobutanoate/2-iminopropanoate deaminase